MAFGVHHFDVLVSAGVFGQHFTAGLAQGVSVAVLTILVHLLGSGDF